MKITSILIGKSIQVVQIGMPEQWIKLSATAELGDNENPIEAVDKLFLFVDESLKSKMPGERTPAIQIADPKQDEEINKQFLEVKQQILDAKSQQAAGMILLASPFKLNAELKQLVNSK